MKTIASIGAVIMLVISAVPAEAARKNRGDRNETPANCEKQMTVEGDRSFTRSGAEDKALKAWQKAAATRHGDYFSDPKKAYTDPSLKHDNPECSSDPDRWAKKWKCSFTAAPCRR